MVELEPDYIRGWCALGDALAGLDRLDDAREAWERGPWAVPCVEGLAFSWLDEDPQRALQGFERSSVLRLADPEVDLHRARALARIDPEAGAAAVRRYLERSGRRTPSLDRALDDLMVHARTETATALLTGVTEVVPDLGPRWELALVERQVDATAMALMGARPAELTVLQASELERALREAAQDPAIGLRRLEGLADLVGRSPEVWTALADVRERVGDIDGAVVAADIARQLTPLDPAAHARFARMLDEHFGGRFDEETFSLLDGIVEAAPDAGTRWRHAEVALRLGRHEAARSSLEWLRAQGSHTERAVELLADLDRVRADGVELPALEPPPDVPVEAWRELHRAAVWLDRASSHDDPTALERASAMIDPVVQAMPGRVEPLNLRARIHATRGDLPAAIRDWRESVARDPGQPAVWEALASVDGDEETWTRSAEAGSVRGVVHLARRDVSSGRWWRALDRLEQAEGLAARPADRAAAESLARTLRFWRAVAGGSAVAVLVGAGIAPLWIRRRRQAGVGTREWLDWDPGSFPEVARAIGTLRHEVFKHKLSLLGALSTADAETSAYAERVLFGPDGAVRS